MPTISISTREDSNNRSMIQPPARTESGLSLRPISLGSLEVLRQPGNPLASGDADMTNIDTRTTGARTTAPAVTGSLRIRFPSSCK